MVWANPSAAKVAATQHELWISVDRDLGSSELEIEDMADSEKTKALGTPTEHDDGGKGAPIQAEIDVPDDLDEDDYDDSLVGEFLLFLKEEKKWWLTPMIVDLELIAGLFVFVEGSAVAPFIYTLF